MSLVINFSANVTTWVQIRQLEISFAPRYQ